MRNRTKLPVASPNILLDAAVEAGKKNPRAAEIAAHLMRVRQLARDDAKTLLVRGARSARGQK